MQNNYFRRSSRLHRRVRAILGLQGREIHFLHLRKCAGTQVGTLARQINGIGKVRILKHGHGMGLKDLPASAEYFFSIRDPISRFHSGFYGHKQRRHNPHHHKSRRLDRHERQAIADFDHANDLAESLFADGPLGDKAFGAMKTLRHLAKGQADWFLHTGAFLDSHPPIWILRQELFDTDFERFLQRANLDEVAAKIEVSTDDLASNRRNHGEVPPFSDKAQANLRRWYEQDFVFVDMCHRWLEAQG